MQPVHSTDVTDLGICVWVGIGFVGGSGFVCFVFFFFNTNPVVSAVLGRRDAEVSQVKFCFLDCENPAGGSQERERKARSKQRSSGRRKEVKLMGTLQTVPCCREIN